MSNPKAIWEKHKNSLSEDFYNTARRNNPNMQVSYTDTMYNMALLDLEKRVINMGGSDLKNLPQPSHTDDDEQNSLEREYLNEMNYDTEQLGAYVASNEEKLTNEQHVVKNSIMESVDRTGEQRCGERCCGVCGYCGLI